LIFIKKYDIIYIQDKEIRKELIHMDKNELIKAAFCKACKYLREHPPADAGWDGDMTILSLLIDAKSDPDGVRWMKYFINEAMKEMEGE
jgi:hypothetical protein